MDDRERKLLYDIQTAIGLIESFANGKTYADYLKDAQLRSAIERQYEIIGEALNRLHKMGSPIINDITDVRRIISFRNVLIHGYDSIEHDVVWDVVENKMPLLKTQVKRLLGGALAE
jgi:uncharacterized protein with HEPN domain